MADSDDIKTRRLKLFDKRMSGELDQATYEQLIEELNALERGAAATTVRGTPWAMLAAAVIVVGAIVAVPVLVLGWRLLDSHTEPPVAATSPVENALPGPAQQVSPTIPPANQGSVAAATTSAAPPAPSSPTPSSTTNNPPSPVAPPAARTPEPEVILPPPAPRQVVTYKWQADRDYAYYVWSQSERGDSIRVARGAVVLKPASVQPLLPAAEDSPSTATAFVVHPDGYLLTCGHCVSDAESCEIVVGDQTFPATIVALDDQSDLALLHIGTRGLTPLPWGDSDQVQVGEDVRAAGYPLSAILGDSLKATRGTISGIDKSTGQTVLHVDAAIHAGNSGGPLVRETGEVIGINFAQLNQRAGGNAGFAVPINAARKFFLGRGIAAPQPAPNQEKLSGPELVRGLAGSVALLRVTAPKYTHHISLTFQSRVIAEQKSRSAVTEKPDQLVKFREALRELFPMGRIVVDPRGAIVQNDVPESAPAMATRFVDVLLAKLPVVWQRKWTETFATALTYSESETVTVNEPDYSRPDFAFPSFGLPELPLPPHVAPPFSHRSFPPPTRQSTTTTHRVTTIPAEEVIEFTAGEIKPDGTVEIEQRSTLHTTDTDPQRPRVEIRQTTRTTFAGGVPRTLECRGQVLHTQGTVTEKSDFMILGRLVEGDEYQRYRLPEEIPNDEVDRLLVQLKQTDKRLAALQRLASVQAVEARKRDVEKALSELLDASNDQFIGRAVVDVLRVWGDQSAVPLWIRLLESPDDHAQRVALEKTVGLADPQLASTIVRKLVLPLRTRSAAVDRLRQMGAVAEPAVLELLEQADSGVKQEACRLLGVFGTTASLVALRDAADDSNTAVANDARAALEKVERRTGVTADSLAPPANTPEQVDQLLADLVGPGRMRALAALRRCDPIDSRRAAVLAALARTAADADPQVKLLTARVLAVWQDATSLPVWNQLLIDARGELLQIVLSNLENVSDARIAETVAQSHVLPLGSRRTAVALLKRMGSVSEPAAIKLLQSPDNGVRAEACRILKEVGTAACIEALTAAQKDPDGLVQRDATEALAVVRARK